MSCCSTTSPASRLREQRQSRRRGTRTLAPQEHRLLEPSQFIPLAERTGLIRPLTHWVLDAALRQCRAWRQAGMPIDMTVNLTAGTSKTNSCHRLFPDFYARPSVPGKFGSR